jgi:hypothetical protein
MEKHNLNPVELASVLDTDVIRIYEYRRGTVAKIPDHILKMIDIYFGVAAEEVQGQYLTWRRELAQEKIERIEV